MQGLHVSVYISPEDGSILAVELGCLLLHFPAAVGLKGSVLTDRSGSLTLRFVSWQDHHRLINYNLCSHRPFLRVKIMCDICNATS